MPAGVPPPSMRAVVAVVLAVAVRPDLWWTALGALQRMAVPGWWRSSPFLPLPDAAWWQFRMVTAYGRPDAVPERADVLSYLEWSRTTARVGPFGGQAARGRRGPTQSG